MSEDLWRACLVRRVRGWRSWHHSSHKSCENSSSELASALPLADGCFVSAEVDPGLLSTATMDELLAFGISVLRFHCLTSNSIESERLERAGAVGEMAKSRIVLESAGFFNIDAQILVGLVGQTEKTVLKTLRELVLSSDVNHCTLLPARGSVAGDAVFATEMFCVASSFLKEHGFVQYAPCVLRSLVLNSQLSVCVKVAM